MSLVRKVFVVGDGVEFPFYDTKIRQDLNEDKNESKNYAHNIQ